MRRTLLIAAVLLLGLAPGVKATAIVAFRFPGRVVLAADSTVTSISTASTELAYKSGDCKIRPAGRWWFLMGGYSGSPGSGIDVYDTIARAISPTTTMAAALAAIETAWTGTLRDRFLSATSLPHFNEMFGIVDQPVLNILVAGLDRDTGEMVIGFSGIYVKSLEPFELTPVGRGTCPGWLCNDGANLFYASSLFGPAVSLMTTEPRPAWLARGDAAAARRVVKLQIAKTPKGVGGVINVLELTAAGAHWIGRDPKSSCAAIP